MITKILFTAAIIAIALLFAGSKARDRRVQEQAPRRVTGPAEPPPTVAAGLKPARYLAYGLLGIMLLGSGSFIFLEWRDQYRVVSVRVTNTNTGRSETFRARRGDVEDRAFETLDGRRIVLSDVERLELGSATVDRQ